MYISILLQGVACLYYTNSDAERDLPVPEVHSIAVSIVSGITLSRRSPSNRALAYKLPPLPKRPVDAQAVQQNGAEPVVVAV